MLNILPGVTGLVVSRHLQISYSAAYDLANLAFWSGLSIRLDRTSPVQTCGARALTLRDGGLRIRIDRTYDAISLAITVDGSSREIVTGLRDMREVLRKIRRSAGYYRRPRRQWWSVVPADQYPYTTFL